MVFVNLAHIVGAIQSSGEGSTTGSTKDSDLYVVDSNFSNFVKPDDVLCDKFNFFFNKIIFVTNISKCN